MHLADVVANHLLRDRGVGDHAIAEWPNRHDIRGGTPEHALRLSTDGEDLARFRLNCNYRGLANDDTLTCDVDERIRRAEVNADVAREEAIDSVKHGAMVAPAPRTPALPPMAPRHPRSRAALSECSPSDHAQ